MDDSKLREEIIRAGRLMIEKGLVQGSGGNISARVPGGLLITPSGMAYDKITPDDIVLLDMSGKTLCGAAKPSVEKELHRRLLAARPDINAVIHTHSVYATAIAATRRNLEPITDNQVIVFGGAVRVAEYAPIGSDALARNAEAALGKGCGALLANHGAVCVGDTIDEAMFRCEMLETFAKIYILARTAGGGIAVGKEQ